MFNGVYAGKRVFVTGHWGFKGSWLTLWLEQLGAIVTGYSDRVPSEPNHYGLLKPMCNSISGDICDYEFLLKSIQSAKPEIVFHLAAQPLVRKSYRSPRETFQSNVMGTVNLLEAVRHTPSVKAVVVITSDKCYENPEDGLAFIESDPMGGHDPYSASKGATELVVSSYRNSFFNPEQYGSSHETLIASVRAGNVIGGGDWGEDRLIPDLMKAASNRETVEIRSPNAIRPWQHVLEPLNGYLLVGQHLLEGDTTCAGGWNFGPEVHDHRTVWQVCESARNIWQDFSFEMASGANLHEAETLRLDCSKASRILYWKPIWNSDRAIEETVEWYKSYYQDSQIITETQLTSFINDATSSLA